MTQDFRFRVYAPELKQRLQALSVYPVVHAGVIHRSHKVEVTHVSTDGRTDKQNVIHTCDGILFSLKKEGHFDNCMSPEDMT